MKIKATKNIILTSVIALGFILTTPINAQNTLSTAQIADIENRVNNMSSSELNQRMLDLQYEKYSLESQQDQTQNPSQNKSISDRVAAINAELSAIQKALIGVAVGAAIINATDDGYDDVVPPVITVLGDNPATVELGSTYTDAGATAMDAFRGTTSVSSTGNVDTSTIGSYTITYSSSDLDGNTATATRTVNVVDTTAPVVTVTGAATVTVELGGTYTESGATASDASGSVSVETSGSVDTNALGAYTITYSSSDASGNTGSATRTVNVTDTTGPTINIVGAATVATELGGTYADAGVELEDLDPRTITLETTSTVDSDTLGAYTVTYKATDSSGNASTATRTVNVTDTTPPTFVSSSTFIVDEGATDVGKVVANDLDPRKITFTIASSILAITEDGDLTFIQPADYESQSDTPVNLPYDGSTYDITATVTAKDSSGNPATQVITVSVRDVGGLDDNVGTGTGTNTNTNTSTSTGTGT